MFGKVAFLGLCLTAPALVSAQAAQTTTTTAPIEISEWGGITYLDVGGKVVQTTAFNTGATSLKEIRCDTPEKETVTINGKTTATIDNCPQVWWNRSSSAQPSDPYALFQQRAAFNSGMGLECQEAWYQVRHELRKAVGAASITNEELETAGYLRMNNNKPHWLIATLMKANTSTSDADMYRVCCGNASRVGGILLAAVFTVTTAIITTL